MDWRILPPLSALRAFAAFGETRNVVDAGKALGVSHAAISQQLRTLEQHLDVPLLDRNGRSLILTPEGERLAQGLQQGFGGIVEIVEEITGQQKARPLHVSVTSTFAASWLMPRLPKFRAAHPQVDLMIDPSANLVSLDADGMDIAIRYGVGPWPGVDAELLLKSPMVVIAAPSLVGEGEIDDLKELARYPWLEEFGTSESSTWLHRLGVTAPSHGMLQVPGNLVLDGARDGHGIAFTVRAFVARDIAAGRLRELHVEENPDAGYHIVTRSGVSRESVKAFVKWLRKEAREPQEGLPAPAVSLDRS